MPNRFLLALKAPFNKFLQKQHQQKQQKIAFPQTGIPLKKFGISKFAVTIFFVIVRYSIARQYSGHAISVAASAVEIRYLKSFYLCEQIGHEAGSLHSRMVTVMKENPKLSRWCRINDKREKMSIDRASNKPIERMAIFDGSHPLIV